MRPVALVSLLIAVAGCSDVSGEAATAPLEVAAVPTSVQSQKATFRPGNAPLAPGQRPVPAIDRVLIISIDGLRPDLLLRAYMPRVRGLCNAGSFTFWAETSPEAYTLPCHVSMLTGAPSLRHGVTWNNYIEESYPNVPTLFEVAKQAGYSTAMATGKMKFIVFTKPGTLDHYYLPPDEPISDREVAARAETLLRNHLPQVMFIHLPGVDTAGHEFGWGSTEQVAAIELADVAVGLILDVLADLGLSDATLVILTTDHGGAGKNHEMNDPRSQFIPWIASGSGLRQNYDLTLEKQCRIRVEDTFATACVFLGIDPGSDCQGNPVLEVLAAEKTGSLNISQP
jgi:predicted AlkP superfamily pyrophosphatase or phosphodiesterase